MSRGSAGSVLADALRAWHPGTTQLSRRVDPWPAAAFADLMGAVAPRLDPGAPLPPLWHWFYLLEHPAQSAIGADGHPAGGAVLPPIPGRRRMFAGGRLRQDSFSYRLVRPAFLPSRLISVGRPAASSAEITVTAQGAEPSLTATAGFC